MSLYSDYVNANCDPDEDDDFVYDGINLLALPNVERCEKCGQNFIAELIYDACPCEGPAGPIPF